MFPPCSAFQHLRKHRLPIFQRDLCQTPKIFCKTPNQNLCTDTVLYWYLLKPLSWSYEFGEMVACKFACYLTTLINCGSN
jgi:hypothetical protein